METGKFKSGTNNMHAKKYSACASKMLNRWNKQLELGISVVDSSSRLKITIDAHYSCRIKRYSTSLADR